MRRDPAFDFSVQSHRSIYLVLPVSQLARAWLEGNVQADSQWFAGALVAEHRFVGELVHGMIEHSILTGNSGERRRG